MTSACGGVAVVAADQATKWAAPSLDRTAIGAAIEPGLNRDYSLGLVGGSQTLLILGALVALGLGGWWAAQSVRSGRVPAWVGALVLGGAMSNLLDRIIRGGVLDFIVTPWIVLNLADLAVVAGLAAFSVAHLRLERR